MINCDFHTHTAFSDDCQIPMDTCIQSAIEQGIEKLAITDHYDPNFPNPVYPFVVDFNRYMPAFLEAKEKYGDRIELLAGVEVGIQDGQFEVSNNILNPTEIKGLGGFEFDVVIGSFHCFRNIDIAQFDFSRFDREPDLLEKVSAGYHVKSSGRLGFLELFYQYALDCISRFSNFDILGHISAIDRYIGDPYKSTETPAGADLIMERVTPGEFGPAKELYDYSKGELPEILDEILRKVISMEKSIEINTSNYRYKMGCWMPRISILKRYHELGGRMLTFGSDSHGPAGYRAHFDEAIEMAKSIGFDQYVTYKKREPEFHRL